jgi:hypothetical protein
MDARGAILVTETPGYQPDNGILTGMNPATPSVPTTDLAFLARTTAAQVAWLTFGMMALSLALQVMAGG